MFTSLHEYMLDHWLLRTAQAATHTMPMSSLYITPQQDKKGGKQLCTCSHAITLAQVAPASLKVLEELLRHSDLLG